MSNSIALLTLSFAFVYGGSASDDTAAKAVPRKGSPDTVQQAPPMEIRQEFHELTSRYGTDFFRDASLSTNDKRVSFAWRLVSPATGVLVNVVASTSESFATEYWPTCMIAPDKDHLYVAGKGTDGTAILERWTFAETSATGAHCPSVLPPDPDLCYTGGNRWSLPPRTKVERVIARAPDDPRGLIRGLLPCLRSPDKLLVYYHASRELYLVDVLTKNQTLQASPTGASASLRVPDLALDYRRCWSADYTARGHCYFLGGFSTEDSYPTMPDHLLVLIDSDRDGKIDAAQLISGKAWTTGGWGDLANIARR